MNRYPTEEDLKREPEELAHMVKEITTRGIITEREWEWAKRAMAKLEGSGGLG